MALQKKLSNNDFELLSINKMNNNSNNAGNNSNSNNDTNGNGIVGIISTGGASGANSNNANNNNSGNIKMPPKKIQFCTPEFSITPIETLPGSTVRPPPNRKREEAIVMANLRKRVAAVDLNKVAPRRNTMAPTLDDISINDTGQTQDQLDNRPLLPKPAGTGSGVAGDRKDRQKNGNNDGGEDSPKVKIVMDKDFIFECMCWHNEYRMRHGAPALSISSELCELASQWANHLASTNELYYQIGTNYGQNIFCCPANSLLTDLSGQEVATYWYSTNRRYDYFKESHLLHTNVNTGHFSQMVWRASKYFGVSKSISKTGKLFVVAYYYPAGNVMGEFRQNVLPPIMANEDPHLSRPPSNKDLENLSASH
ncbi:myb-like protein U [Sabethes cyaneus]|uniref:myb-like protein U n=1 Tax=Sabethes cyaneus TaxID=53552 RepID=UPI00237ED68F|nr:myb-like protein U [Sabethes cyaneus]